MTPALNLKPRPRLVIIGGGAAGFFCAVNAARLNPNLNVVILERSGKLLSKVRISGGGRCNVTHACFSIAEMIKKYPRGASFLKKALHHFSAKDTISWFGERGVKLKTEPDGRMFPVSDNSQTIIDCLLKEAAKYKVEVVMNTGVKAIKKESAPLTKETPFELLLENNKSELADYICVASGGYAKPLQFEWITKLGHQIEPPVPSLFTFNIPDNNITALMGITADAVSVKIKGTKLQQTGALLITHWGMSGPAILKLSAWAARDLSAKNYQFEILLNWLPAYNENSLKDKFHELRFAIASQKIYNRNPFFLPARLWEYFLKWSGIHEDLRWADLPAKEQNLLIKNLCTGEFEVKGKTTFKEEFVTSGGIKPEQVDVNTMQSKIVPGLFFAGEVMNIDGITGGFNFQNAWTTGWIAAAAIAENK